MTLGRKGFEDGRRIVIDNQAPSGARGPGILLKHSGTFVYVLLATKITKIGLISAEICLLASKMTETEHRAVFQFSARIFRTKNFDANFLDFAKDHVTRFGLSHNIDDYMRFSRSNRKIIGTRGTLVDHS